MLDDMKDDDFSEILISMDDCKPETIKRSIQKLSSIVASENYKTIIEHLNIIIPKLEFLLKNDDSTVVTSTSQLILDLIIKYSRELDSFYPSLLEKIILNLGDSKLVIKNIAQKILLEFIKRIKNLDLVYQKMMRIGLEHPDTELRSKIILSIPRLVEVNSSCLTVSGSFKTLIEKVIEKSYNEIETVKSASMHVLNYLGSHYSEAFESLVKTLPVLSQEKVFKFVKKGYKHDLSVIENGYMPTSPIKKTVGESFKPSTPRIKPNIADSPVRTTASQIELRNMEGPYDTKFGIFKAQTIDDAFDDDWRLRSSATEDILTTFEKVDSLVDLIPHLGQFVQLAIKLVNDPNFKICINALNITGFLLKNTTDEEISEHIKPIIESLLKKLGDSKIAVRQIGIQILLIAARKTTAKKMIEIILPNLSDTNWHMREESLALISAILNLQLNKLTTDYYEEMIEKIIELLDDSKSKVRNAAREAIIEILKHSGDGITILNRIKDFLEKDLFEYMLKRLEFPDMPPEEFLQAHITNVESARVTILKNIYEKQTPIQTKHRITPSAGSNINLGEYSSRNNNPYYPSSEPSPHTRKLNSRFESPNVNMGYTPLRNATPYEMISSQISTISNNNTGFFDSVDRAYGIHFTPSPFRNDYLRNDYSRTGVSSRASGKHPSSVSPAHVKKYPFDLSTAGSTQSGYSHLPGNTVYSFESSFSNLSALDRLKISRQNKRNLTPSEARTQSAHMQLDYNPNLGGDKRNFSAVPDTSTPFINRLSQKLTKNTNQDVYLEYTTIKGLEDFGTSNFDQMGGQYTNTNTSTLEPHPDEYTKFVHKNAEKQNQLDTSLQHEVKIKRSSNNPYRNSKYDLTQKLKQLHSQHGSQSDHSHTPEPRHKTHSVNTSHLSRNQENEIIEEETEFEKGFTLKGTSKIPRRKFAKNSNLVTNANDATNNGTLEYKKQSYINREDLQPIEGNLEQVLKSINQDLKSEEWTKQFEALNLLRRLNQHHMNFLNTAPSFSLHATTTEIVRNVESLRSNVSKNALITLNEIASNFKKQLDVEAENIIVKLLKKGNDTNTFISEEVKKTLISISQNCSDTKIIPCLIALTNQKAIPAKLNICLCLEAIILKHELRTSQLRDFEKIVILLGNYMIDSSAEVRNISKRAICTLSKFLLSRSEIDKIFLRNFTEMNYNKIMSILDREILQPKSPLMITNSQKVREEGSVTSRVKTGQKINKNRSFCEEEKDENKQETQKDQSPSPSPVITKKSNNHKEQLDLEALNGYFIQSENTDWRSRYEAVNSLTDFGKKHAEILGKSKLVNRFFDCYVKLLLDSNIKVSSFAINSFTELITPLKSGIEINMLTISNVMLNLLGTTNSTIKIATDSLFQSLIRTIDYSFLIPSWTSALPFSNVKAKVAILTKLNELAPGLYNKKSVLITKNVIPLIAKLIDDSRAEVKSATKVLLLTLHGILGKSLHEYVPTHKLQAVLEVIGQ